MCRKEASRKANEHRNRSDWWGLRQGDSHLWKGKVGKIKAELSLLDAGFETVNSAGTAAEACDLRVWEAESGKSKSEARLRTVSGKQNKTNPSKRHLILCFMSLPSMKSLLSQALYKLSPGL